MGKPSVGPVGHPYCQAHPVGKRGQGPLRSSCLIESVGTFDFLCRTEMLNSFARLACSCEAIYRSWRRANRGSRHPIPAYHTTRVLLLDLTCFQILCSRCWLTSRSSNSRMIAITLFMNDAGMVRPRSCTERLRLSQLLSWPSNKGY